MPYLEAPSKIIALEQIVRLGIPGGSAVINRFRELGGARSSSAAEYAARYEVKLPLESWSPLPHPICDWQTKYEDGDRNLDPQEALYISGLSASRLTALGELLTLCSLLVDSILSAGALKLWDLKWEAAVRQSGLLMADTMDHDSMRVTYLVPYAGKQCNIHFNKQAIRDYCKVFHQEWVNSITEAKRVSKSRPDNRKFMDLYREGVECGEYPPVPSLDPVYTDLMALKYQYVTDAARGYADEATGLSLARQELIYYENRGRLDALIGNTAPVVLQ
jgi:phosphoribosylaminoimidazole-succinocarboxamide synthase